MKSKESTESLIAALLLLAVSFIAGTFAIKYGWNDVFVKWIDIKRPMTFWNAFALNCIMAWMFAPSCFYEPDGKTALNHSIHLMGRYGFLWLILWCAS